jgi:multiple sugar transport system ATP-binding protein
MELYRRPLNQFVAGFIGSPAMNFVRGTIRRDGENVGFAAPGLALRVAGDSARHAGDVVLGVRPQDIALDRALDGQPRAVVSLVEPLGSEQIVHLTMNGGGELVALVGSELAPRVDEVVSVRVPPQAAHLFDPVSGARLPASA